MFFRKRMKLLELYSRACNLEIGSQQLLESFYPIETERYITVQASSGMAAKNYPHYNEVLALLADYLRTDGIVVVQLGGKDDIPLNGVVHLQGKTTLHQSSHILRNAILHIGNDSWMAHRAGALRVPLVCVYGPTTVANHGPYEYDVEKTILIESHRFGRNPTFQAQENPSTINAILPEQVANAALKLLGLPSISRSTQWIGPSYHTPLVELAPNVVVIPQVNINGALVIRTDYHFDESLIAQNLQIRKCALVLDREISLQILSQFKQNIVSIRVEIDKISPKWITAAKKLGIPMGFFAAERDEEKLRKMRMDYFEATFFDQFVPPTREDFLKSSAQYLNKPLDTPIKLDTLMFKTNKFLLADGKVYLSKAHWKAGKPAESTNHNTGFVIDNEDFWQDQQHFYFYTV